MTAETGFKAALEGALVEHPPGVQREQIQTDLFDDAGLGSSEPARALVALPEEGRRGPGRPPGATNKRTDAISKYYASRLGDPLAAAMEIAGIRIIANEGAELGKLARWLGMERADAAKFWLGCVQASLPHLHQRLATLTVKPEGSPDGVAIELPWAAGVDEIYQLTALEASPAADDDVEGSR